MNNRLHRTCGMAIALAIVLTIAPTTAAQVGNNSDILNPNLASRDEILALPHIDEALANALLEARPFLSVAAMNDFFRGALSAEQCAELYLRVFVPLNLNTATRDEILLVPAVGNRMAHEFEEYRPYRALAQFRREMP